MSIFKEARLIARHCTDKDKCHALKTRTDTAQAAADMFHLNPCRGTMEELVGAWTRFLIALNAVGPYGGGDGSGAGRLRLPGTGTFNHDPDIHDVLEKLTQAA